MCLEPIPGKNTLWPVCPGPRIRLFGPMRAECADGVSFLPRNIRTRAVLAVLALADARPVSRSLLMTLLWSTRGREQAQASLRQSVHELRGILASLKGACLKSAGNRLILHAEDLWVDGNFVQTPRFTAPHMQDVFRGPLLGDLFGLSDSFDAWILDERRRLSGGIRHKLESFLTKSPDHATTVRMAEKVLSFDISHAAAWMALVQAYRALGDTAAALDVYHRYASEVRKFGAAPGLDLNTLLAECLTKQATDGNSALPATKDAVDRRPPRALRSRRAFAVPWRAAYLAVAPTRGIGGAASDFAACIDWQIMSALCKFDDLSCAPAPRGIKAEISAQDLATEGFDFLLELSVEHRSDQDHLSVRLRDLHLTGEVFWSQRMCRKASRGSHFDTDFAAVLAPQIAAEILKQQSFVVENCPESELNVCELALRASRSVERLDRQSLFAADTLLSGAMKRNPRQPALLAWSAYIQLLQLGQGWVCDGDATQRRIGELVDTCLSFNPDNASILSIAGHVLAFTQNRLEEGLSLQERALSKNGQLPSAWLFSGLAHTYAGEHTEAINRLQRAKLLSPADQQAYFIDMGLSLSYLLGGDIENALRASKTAIRLNPIFSSSFKVGVSASGYRDAGSGEGLLKRLLLLEPALTVDRVLSRSPLTRRADRMRLSDGLRKAGLPA